MHDVSGMRGPIRIRRADGGETMLPIFHEEPETAAAGDLLWETDEDILALLGPVSRDADQCKVTTETTGVVVMVPGNPTMSTADGRALCHQTFDLIKRTCPSAEMEFLDVQHAPSMGNPTATPADD